MRDGVSLAATIWLPVDAEENPVPAVLEFIPYRRRDFTAGGDTLHHPYIAGQGYAAVRCDLRGNGDSEGLFDDEYSPTELADGCDVLAWLASQPWCTGKTGMMGISWGGFNCLQVAALRPPSLKAVYSVASTDDRYADDIHFMGGCLLNDNLNWGATMTTFSLRPPDPVVVGERWREMWLERLNGAPCLPIEWLHHQRRDGQWRHGSVCENYDDIEAAVYMVGGWADGYTNAIFRTAAGIKAPFRGLVGPWTHAYPWNAVPGPEIDGLRDLCRWWDHWLKDVDTGMMQEPRLRCYMQDSMPPRTFYDFRPGKWVGETAWPSRGINNKILYLNSNGLCDNPGDPMERIHSADVLEGMTHGEWCPYGYAAEMPSDQREEDARSLVFDSPVLVEPLEVLGMPELELTLVTTSPQTQLYARLCDVAPDGASTRVSFGILNLSHRDGHTSLKPMPHDSSTVTVPINNCGHVFARGHRLRVTIQTGSWPLVWPSPELATIRITTGASRLRIPVRDGQPSDAELPDLGTPAIAEPLETTVWRPYQRGRKMTRDFDSGVINVEMVKDRGHYRIEQTGVELAGKGTENYSITEGDPLSAKAHVAYEISFKRAPDWNARVETTFEMTSTRDAFLVRANADAWDGNKKIWTKTWNDTIPRDGV